MWKGLVFYRIEIFVWTALLNKVKIKDKLKKFGVVFRDEVMCVLCSKMEEDC